MRARFWRHSGRLHPDGTATALIVGTDGSGKTPASSSIGRWEVTGWSRKDLAAGDRLIVAGLRKVAYPNGGVRAPAGHRARGPGGALEASRARRALSALIKVPTFEELMARFFIDRPILRRVLTILMMMAGVWRS